MATDTFMCVIMYVVSLLSLSLEVFAQRNCSPGMFCPIGANCTSSTNLCTIVCPTEADHMQQGNLLLETVKEVSLKNYYLIIVASPSCAWDQQ